MATGAKIVGKSPEAFRTISEVAAQLETPAHVLRFWESKFTQIKPVKRAGGRRYYRPDDIALLAGIKVLLHDQGMTIRGVAKLLKERGVRYVATLSSLPWEGTEPSEDDLPAEEDVVLEVVEEPAPEAVIVGPWLAALVEEAPVQKAVPALETVEKPVAMARPETVRPAVNRTGTGGLGELRVLITAADRERLRAQAGRLGPLVTRLRALRNKGEALPR